MDTDRILLAVGEVRDRVASLEGQVGSLQALFVGGLSRSSTPPAPHPPVVQIAPKADPDDLTFKTRDVAKLGNLIWKIVGSAGGLGTALAIAGVTINSSVANTVQKESVQTQVTVDETAVNLKRELRAQQLKVKEQNDRIEEQNRRILEALVKQETANGGKGLPGGLAAGARRSLRGRSVGGAR